MAFILIGNPSKENFSCEKAAVHLVIERPCLESPQNSEVIDRVKIINGTVPGNITRAMNGEHVGTIVYRQ